MVFPYPTQGYVRLAGMPFHTKSAKVSPNGSTIRKHTHATWVALCMVVLLGFLCTHAAASQTAELFVQLGHTDAVWSVAWSPDGRSLASGSEDRTVKVWDVERGELLHTLSGHTDVVFSVAWSPNGRRLASSSGDWTVKVWDVEQGKLLRTLSGHTNRVWSVAWSPNGRSLASSSSIVTIWADDSDEMKVSLALLPGHEWLAYRPKNWCITPPCKVINMQRFVLTNTCVLCTPWSITARS
jgi:WD40 repeat protein